MLTDRQNEMLAFERQSESRRGDRAADIRARFDVSPTRYFQELHQLIEIPEALAADPMLVRRLQRLRVERRRARSRPAGTER